MKNIVALLFVLFVHSSHSQNCLGDYPIYYTKTNAYLYQEMNSNAAIVKEIPKGEAVKVVSSFLGNTGFWEICWKGKTAYALKDKLSFTNISSNAESNNNSSNSNNENYEDQDVGFDPFLGQTTSAVNFRANASSKSEKIKTLSAGSTLYIYSKQTINGYYKAIDVMTSDIGWVYNNYVKYIEDININESGAFQSTGYSSTYNSEVNVENRSSYTNK